MKGLAFVCSPTQLPCAFAHRIRGAIGRALGQVCLQRGIRSSPGAASLDLRDQQKAVHPQWVRQAKKRLEDARLGAIDWHVTTCGGHVQPGFVCQQKSGFLLEGL